jgi:hypothetical protein
MSTVMENQPSSAAPQSPDKLGMLFWIGIAMSDVFKPKDLDIFIDNNICSVNGALQLASVHARREILRGGDKSGAGAGYPFYDWILAKIIPGVDVLGILSICLEFDARQRAIWIDYIATEGIPVVVGNREEAEKCIDIYAGSKNADSATLAALRGYLEANSN